MTLEDQVTSLEISKRLKEFGVKQESLWFWYEPKGLKVNPSLICDIDQDKVDNYEYSSSAFTVAELGELLPSDEDEKNIVDIFLHSYM